jgi:hypothetical protein
MQGYEPRIDGAGWLEADELVEQFDGLLPKLILERT